jgi:hypothetical protein
MKSKAKPAKGSARTKRFDVGGTVGALAGLGTLAYLMSRKKKGADGAEPSKDYLKDAIDRAPKQPDTPTADDAGRQRALQQSKDPKSNLVPEGADKDVLYESDKALVRTDDKKAVKKPVINKPRIPPKAQVSNSGQGSSTNTGVRDVTTSLKSRNAVTLEKGTGTRNAAPRIPDSKSGKLADLKQIGPDSDAAKAIRQQRAQRLGTSYNSQYKALQTAPEGPGKEALKKAVDKAKQDYDDATKGLKRGGAVKKYAAGGSVKTSGMGSVKTAKPSMGSASKRADGIAQRGKTRGKVC